MAKFLMCPSFFPQTLSGTPQGRIFVFIFYNVLGRGFQFLFIWGNVFEKKLESMTFMKRNVQICAIVSTFWKKGKEK